MARVAYLLDNRQNPRFGIVIPVSPNSQIDFLREGIDFIRGCELEDAVRGCERHLVPGFWTDGLRIWPGMTAVVLQTNAYRQTSLQRSEGLCVLPLAGLLNRQTSEAD